MYYQPPEPRLRSPQTLDSASFCFPVCIDLDHRDYMWRLTAILHIATALIALVSFRLAVWLIVMVAIIVSAKYCCCQQSTVKTYRQIIGIAPDHWVLVSVDGLRSVVALAGLKRVGPLLFIRLRRFGDSIYWLTTEARQKPAQWHRIRVIAQLCFP